jgi:uncharacterized protein YndB with AHSA1/START domain
MDTKRIARASVTINAAALKVWDALINPEIIKQYFFGTTVVTDWREGSPIIWKGEWQGKTYEDKGIIIKNQQQQTIQYTHFSPLSGLPDKPENYHTLTIDVSIRGNQTLASLSQDNNPTEQAREHSEKNWDMVLTGLKKLLEE